MTSTKVQQYEDIREEFEGALRLRDEGKFEEARGALAGLTRRRPEAAFIHKVLGGVLWSLGDLAGAAASFGRASELSPKSELASIGLFLMLNKLGRREEAYAKMRRFRALRPSEEYTFLLEELRPQLSDEEYLRLVGEKKPPAPN